MGALVASSLAQAHELHYEEGRLTELVCEEKGSEFKSRIFYVGDTTTVREIEACVPQTNVYHIQGSYELQVLGDNLLISLRTPSALETVVCEESKASCTSDRYGKVSLQSVKARAFSLLQAFCFAPGLGKRDLQMYRNFCGAVFPTHPIPAQEEPYQCPTKPVS